MSNKSLSSVSAAAMLLLFVAADSARPDAPKPDARPPAVRKVKTAAELLAAIGPNRNIEVAPGEYDLGKVPRRRLKHVGWRNPHDDNYEPVIRNVANLTIRCSGKKHAHVFLGAAYATVLNFENCSKVELSGLKIGHWPDPGYCMGDVISAEGCKGITIRACVLYGCGTAGLRLSKVEKLTFERSTIEGCTYGILEASNCDHLAFEFSVFRRCMKYYGFQFGDSGHVTFTNCRIEGNSVDAPLFKTSLNAPEDRIRLLGCFVLGNGAKALAQPSDMVALTKTEVRSNAWQASAEVVRQRGKKTAVAGGGWTYRTDLGDASFQDVSFQVYRKWNLAEKLAKANPKLREPLLPGTLITCPPPEAPKPKPPADDDF